MSLNRARFFKVFLIWGMISAAGMSLPFSAIGLQDLGNVVKQVLNQKRTGDFDRMLEEKVIRALVPYSKTFYFLDGAAPKGATYDMLKSFEKHLNKKLKTKHLKIHIVVIPTSRDKLIPDLAEGLGEIAAGNLTITEDRLNQVDFSNPLTMGISEILVTGPASPKVNTLSDLSNQKAQGQASARPLFTLQLGQCSPSFIGFPILNKNLY